MWRASTSKLQTTSCSNGEIFYHAEGGKGSDREMALSSTTAYDRTARWAIDLPDTGSGVVETGYSYASPASTNLYMSAYTCY